MAEATITRTARPWFLLLDPAASPAFVGHPAAASFETVDVPLPTIHTTVTGLRAPNTAQQTIRPEASLLFVAGAGWTKKQADGQVHTG